MSGDGRNSMRAIVTAAAVVAVLSIVGLSAAGLPAAAADGDPSPSPFIFMSPSIVPSVPAPAKPAANDTFQTLLQAAQRGNAEAQVKVAVAYLTTQSNPQLTPQQKAAGLAQAAKWARAAADQNHAVGQAVLGMMYEAGLGLPPNKPEAVRLYRLSAAQGNALGEVRLGNAYLNGLGVPQDYAEAREQFVKAAGQNNNDAENYLGVMYAKGQGVGRDPAEAIRWYRRAAASGNPTAQMNLAVSYARGGGVPTDPMLAYFWSNLAAARLAGNFQAMAIRERDAMAQRLSPAELARAQTMARDWTPGGASAETVEADLRRDLAASPAAAAPVTAGRRLTGSGTGFAVTRLGHVLTNAHVVNGCGEVRVRPPGDAAVAGEVTARDLQNDLAVIKLPKSFAQIASFRATPNLRQGENVIVYGFPLSDVLAAEGNLSTGTVSALAGLNNDSRQLQTSAPVQPGNSGGPLVDMSGNIVGVVVAKLDALAMMRLTGDVPQNVNFAIKSSVAESFLEANGVDYHTAASAQALQSADVADRVRRFTMKVECWR
jgi:uncharacterized protein